MPNMNRLTWSGVALHAGNLPGYPASHGCVRLPLAFSALLFSITTVGMTAVIADEDSQPTDVVHPGMVLGDYARREFDAVDRANLAHQYSAAHASEVVVTSVVVSRKDSSNTTWENGRIVASGRAKIIDPDKPLGSRVYTLTKLDKQSDALTWVSATYSERSKSNEDKQALMRIRAYAKIRAEIEKRMQQGMTLVTTDDSANAKTSSGPGFTVMTGVF
jgi:lipoprotein-anchoring transpeptidase ErfK/SrfK